MQQLPRCSGLAGLNEYRNVLGNNGRLMASVVKLPGINLVIHDDTKLLVEEQVEHQHKAMAVSGKAGLVVDRLDILCRGSEQLRISVR